MKSVDEAIVIIGECLQDEEGFSEHAEVLRNAKRELQRERRELEISMKNFELEMEMKQRSFESAKRLFEMKWKILEDETRRLAEDNEKAEKRRQFYERVNSFENNKSSNCLIDGEVFFRGVNTPQALKKRYRDLIKIFHPDSDGGDNVIVQEINKEYEELKRAMNK